jgi:hypothetical protein
MKTFNIKGDYSQPIENMTGSDINHVPCPEVCSAHAQPEVAQYPPWWVFFDRK